MPTRGRATSALCRRSIDARTSTSAFSTVAGAVAGLGAAAGAVAGLGVAAGATAALFAVTRAASAELVRATGVSPDVRRVGSAGLKRGASGGLGRAPFPLLAARGLMGEVARDG